jgi:drug/metabolite transporter (DMT)-like permease
MSPKLYGIVFALLTALFWGMYGPSLQTSRVPGQSPFKPFILIGVAYLVFGILGGVFGIVATKDHFQFEPVTVKWGFIAGSLGAFGALTLTLALFKSRAPDLVMPIVFGGATLVSVIIGLLQKKELFSAHPMQYLGTLAVIVGVVLVQAYASHGPAKPGAGSSAPVQAAEAAEAAEVIVK